MRTLTPEEFEKIYGKESLNEFPVTLPERPSFLTRTKETFSQGISKMGRAISESRQGVNPLSTGSKFGAGAVEAVFSPAIAAAQPIIEPTVGQGIEFASEKISNIPAVQKFATSKAGQITARIAEDVGNIAAIGGALVGQKGTSKALGVGARSAKEGISATVAATKQLVKKTPTLDEIRTAAIKDATPDFEALAPGKRGQYLARTQEGGIIEGRSIKPNALEIEAGEQLSKVPGYDANATKLVKYQAANKEVTRMARKLESDLRAEDVVVPKREVQRRVVDAVNQVPKESLLLQKSDPVIQNYFRVMRNALAKEPGNLLGVLRLRKVLDDAYENARGKQAFGSDKISALDDVHKAARDALTNYLIETASTNVKLSLREQWNLFRALDELKAAAEKESGSLLGRFVQKHPTATRVIRGTSQAVGIGQAVNILAP